uniref:Uncharacterized protein n=1 Tax=Rhizophora mucronata TaxID=61149 RepID=A0A2P2N4R4_RHIMU
MMGLKSRKQPLCLTLPHIPPVLELHALGHPFIGLKN